MKLHVLGIPHTQTNKQFTTCAFTQKVLKLCAMMHRRGHEVIHYGTEGSEVECTEHVSVVSKAEWEAVYPHPGKAFYNHAKMDGEHAVYLALWAERTRLALAARSGKPGTEIVCQTWGGAQRDACKFDLQFHVESGIGYPNSWASFRVYESYAWMHMHLGRDGGFGGEKWYWAVIPNAFDLTDFEYREERGEEFLFLGRLNHDKGIEEAIRVTKEIGAKLTIAGQGDPSAMIAGQDHVTYLGPVGPEDRKKLLAECKAVLCPTFYVEPFCGVNVEAQLSGAPVITTDWGAFPETVLHGRTGYRCRTYEQMVWAAKHIDTIRPKDCRQWAADNFSMERIALMYEEFFQQVLNVRSGQDVKTEGFYAAYPNRSDLEWLRKRYSVAEPKFDLKKPHMVPPEPEVASEWTQAQEWERDWWGLEWGPRWDEEIKKQEEYFRMMGLRLLSEKEADFEGQPAALTMGTKRILDVGSGPVSVLQRSIHGPSRAVDPLSVSDETRRRYANAGVEFLNIKAEDMPVDTHFDEAWMYNCLQHTENPDVILDKMTQMTDSVRIFEWLVPDKYPGHPQCLTEALFARHFPDSEWHKEIWNVGTLRDHHGGITAYIAIHAQRRKRTFEVSVPLALGMDGSSQKPEERATLAP